MNDIEVSYAFSCTQFKVLAAATNQEFSDFNTYLSALNAIELVFEY
jgi:hypothetical protein